MYPWLAHQWKVDLPRKLDFKPDLEDFRTHWKTFAKRYRVDRVAVGSEHHWQHQYSQEKDI